MLSLLFDSDTNTNIFQNWMNILGQDIPLFEYDHDFLDTYIICHRHIVISKTQSLSCLSNYSTCFDANKILTFRKCKLVLNREVSKYYKVRCLQIKPIEAQGKITSAATLNIYHKKKRKNKYYYKVPLTTKVAISCVNFVLEPKKRHADQKKRILKSDMRFDFIFSLFFKRSM